MPGYEFIQNPGPTNIPDEVRAALGRRAVDFAEPAFEAMVQTCYDDLAELFGTSGEVVVYATLGHGAWEASLVNCFEQGDVALLPETGVFASVWGQMASDLGIEVQVLSTDWRSPISAEAVHDALVADTERRIKGVLITHTETATGVTSDLDAIGSAIRASGHPALYVVDAVASLATTPLHMDRSGIDVALSASQKGLMGAPGLGFTAVGPRAAAHCQTIRRPRAYWSWPGRLGATGYQRFCGTPPEHLLFGLRAALDLLAAEGLEQVFARHRRLAGAVHAAVAHWGGALELNCLAAEARAAAVTCIRTADGVDADKLRTDLRERWHVSVGAGLGPLAGRAFRIGHLGALNEPMILGVLAAVEAALAVGGVPHQPGGVTAAIDQLIATISD
jgi:alanine-glyoxylate transaminase/serine-glyoxylate transaminase/serine-pyruvate transaminase